MTNDEVIEWLREWPFMGKAMEKAAADRIEALIAERDAAWKRAAHAEEMWGRAEVKLAKTRLALNYFLLRDPDKQSSWEYTRDRAEELARTTLAELTSSEAAYNEVKGGKDE